MSEKSKPFIKEFKRELSTLLKIRPHPNLVSLIGVSQHDDNLYLVMEFCKGGTLFDILHKKRNTLSRVGMGFILFIVQWFFLEDQSKKKN